MLNSISPYARQMRPAVRFGHVLLTPEKAEIIKDMRETASSVIPPNGNCVGIVRPIDPDTGYQSSVRINPQTFEVTIAKVKPNSNDLPVAYHVGRDNQLRESNDPNGLAPKKPALCLVDARSVLQLVKNTSGIESRLSFQP